MPTLDELRPTMMAAAQGAATLNLAFIGVTNGLFDTLAEGPLSAAALATRAGLDAGYVRRWCEAAFAFGMLDLGDAGGATFALTDLGRAFRPSTPGTLMPFAIQIFKPGGQDRDVYQFDPRTSLIDKGLDMFRDFSKPMTPLGYKFILDDVSAGPQQPPTGGGGFAPPARPGG